MALNLDIYQGDPKITIDGDGADMTFINGQPVMDQGVENLAAISLFTDGEWLGNILYDVTQEQIGSGFEESVRQPITLSNLIDTQLAAEQALKVDAFNRVEVTVNNPLNIRRDIKITIQPPGQDIQTLLLTNNGYNWVLQNEFPAHERP